MPINPANYPADWHAISSWVRYTRAQGQCECSGQCGLHRGRRCGERHHCPATWARGTIRLTVHHLCTCQPLCNDPRHLLAMCQRCHLRADIPLHLQHRRLSRGGGTRKPPPEVADATDGGGGGGVKNE